MWVVGFIWVGWVQSGAPLVSSGSFGFVGFIWARPGSCRVHSGTPWVSSAYLGFLGSLGRALWVVRFIRVC